MCTFSLIDCELIESEFDIREDLRPKLVIASRFELLKRLGGGGFGEVWSANDKFLNLKVAIKLCPFENDPKKDRTTYEVKFLRRLPRDRFVNIYDYFIDEKIKIHGYSMEILAQENWVSLDNYIVNGNIENINGSWIRYRITIEIYKDLLKSLNHLHSRKWTKTNKNYSLVHGDIKPHNIYVNKIGIDKLVKGFGNEYSLAKIGDFGLSRIEGNKILGKTHGFAPTVDLSIGKLTKEFDLYSLGQSLAYNISGNCIDPRKGITNTIKCEIERFAKNDKFAENLKQIIAGMTKKHPCERDNSIDILRNINFSELQWQIIRVIENNQSNEITREDLLDEIMASYFKPALGKIKRTQIIKDDIKKNVGSLCRTGLLIIPKRNYLKLNYSGTL